MDTETKKFEWLKTLLSIVTLISLFFSYFLINADKVFLSNVKDLAIQLVPELIASLIIALTLYFVFIRKDFSDNERKIEESSKIMLDNIQKINKIRQEVSDKDEIIIKLQDKVRVLAQNPDLLNSHPLTISLSDALTDVKTIVKLENEKKNAELSLTLDALCQNVGINWPKILVVSKFLQNSNLLIEKLINRNEKDSFRLAILCVGHAKNIIEENVFNLFIKINHYYHSSGQIPTYLIAEDLSIFGKTGLEALYLFLDRDYTTLLNQHKKKYLDEFIEEVLHDKEVKERDKFRPYGMLRRAAIDTIGEIKDQESVNRLTEAFESYQQLENQAKIPSEKEEWMHNKWHIVFALHKCMCQTTATFFLEYLKNNKPDLILKYEIYYHLILYKQKDETFAFDENTALKEIKSDNSIKALKKLLADKFIWSRAHLCEIVYRLSQLDKHLDEILYKELNELIKGLTINKTENQMVRHYACYSISKIGRPSDIKWLILLINDETAKGWIKYASIEAVERIVHRFSIHLGDNELSVLRTYIKTGVKEFSANMNRPTSEQVALSNAIKLVGEFGNVKDIEIIQNYIVFDKNLLGSGNINSVARKAIENCAK